MDAITRNRNFVHEQECGIKGNLHRLASAASEPGAIRSSRYGQDVLSTRMQIMPNHRLKQGTTGLLLMCAMLAFSSLAAVCVTSGGIATLRSDKIEITNDAVIEVDADVATINVRVINISQVEVEAQLFNSERINYFLSPSGGTPATNVKIHALVSKDLRLRAKAIIDIGAPPGASIIVRSGLGNVTVFGTRQGTVTVTTDNGFITVTGPAASYDLETLNGNIKGIGLTGPIRAKTRNGSINVDIDPPANSSSSMETRNGDVNVTLGIESSVDVFGAVKVGRIEAPEFATIGRRGHEVTGVFNGGDAEVNFQLKNGTIRLKIAP